MYIKTQWVNGRTRLNATNMNKIEEGIASIDRDSLKTSSILKGTTPPTTSTVANFIGQNYIDTNEKTFYVCVGIQENQYLWSSTGSTITIDDNVVIE